MYEICPLCNGTGVVYGPSRTRADTNVPVSGRRSCGKCGGTGELAIEWLTNGADAAVEEDRFEASRKVMQDNEKRIRQAKERNHAATLDCKERRRNLRQQNQQYQIEIAGGSAIPRVIDALRHVRSSIEASAADDWAADTELWLGFRRTLVAILNRLSDPHPDVWQEARRVLDTYASFLVDSKHSPKKRYYIVSGSHGQITDFDQFAPALPQIAAYLDCPSVAQRQAANKLLRCFGDAMQNEMTSDHSQSPDRAFALFALWIKNAGLLQQDSTKDVIYDLITTWWSGIKRLAEGKAAAWFDSLKVAENCQRLFALLGEHEKGTAPHRIPELALIRCLTENTASGQPPSREFSYAFSLEFLEFFFQRPANLPSHNRANRGLLEGYWQCEGAELWFRYFLPPDKASSTQLQFLFSNVRRASPLTGQELAGRVFGLYWLRAATEVEPMLAIVQNEDAHEFLSAAVTALQKIDFPGKQRRTGSLIRNVKRYPKIRDNPRLAQQYFATRAEQAFHPAQAERRCALMAAELLSRTSDRARVHRLLASIIGKQYSNTLKNLAQWGLSEGS